MNNYTASATDKSTCEVDLRNKDALLAYSLQVDWGPRKAVSHVTIGSSGAVATMTN